MSAKVAKVTISIPAEVLDAVERERHIRKETRSEFFRRAVDMMLRQQREKKAVRRYVRGYRKSPESAAEVAVAYKLGSAVLAEEPWE
ncbi:MAG: ribbon-helix-helix protein, CopG family [Dehalococcoidia bacterium]|nr:ribbon-helix-helix protein, CopG family [Dehalococcoidia bacterium]